jgi:hypothetical protein
LPYFRKKVFYSILQRDFNIAALQAARLPRVTGPLLFWKYGDLQFSTSNISGNTEQAGFFKF